MPRPFDIAQLELNDSEVLRLQECCGDAEVLCFDDGEYFFQEDEERDEVYMVLRGAFVVEQRNGKADKEIIASQCVSDDEPCFVGEMAYFGGGSRTAAVRSSGATFALVLKPRHMDAILGSFPGLTRTFCSQLSMRLRETNDTLKRITAGNAMQASQVNLEEGEVLVRQGDTPDRLYHLLFGDLVWEVDGEEVSGETIQEFVEPVSYLSNAPYPVTVRARSPSCLVAIEKVSKEAVVRNYPGLVLHLFERGLLPRD